MLNRPMVVMVVSGEDLWGAEKIRLALSEAGFKVVAAEDWEVKDIIHQHRPALIIANLSGNLDVDLEMCRGLSRLSEAPIVAISSSIDSDYHLAIFTAGVNDFMVRPINSRELIARVRNILRRTLHLPSSLDAFPLV